MKAREELYEMDLHESIGFKVDVNKDQVAIIRVPGGWLYNCFIIRNY